ncbi:hypothetical protein NDU88_004842 [Pleurodeles waltl]|uniref:Uncharacterized protein n=1 Tax=Pleurodeles waltl TaxID=8319 RepID=A0AAV7VL02_PLEWA|nr:hypothetical protein NDU88_004842 [Pleurodeles waltl]
MCSRLSTTPAPDAPDWRCPHGGHNGDDGFSRCQDNESRSALENPDVRVLKETKREDGFQGGGEKDAEETDNEEDAETQGDREEHEDADWRHWNSGGQRGVPFSRVAKYKFMKAIELPLFNPNGTQYKTSGHRGA